MPALKSRYIVVLSRTETIGQDQWTRSQVGKWIGLVGGTSEGTTITKKTTHVVCGQDVWDEQGIEIRNALDAVKGGRKIWIVKLEWLSDTLQNSRKAKEQNYEWLTPPQFPPLQQSTTSNEKGEEVDTVMTMADVLLEGTKGHVDSHDLEDLRKILAEKRAITHEEIEADQEIKRQEQARLDRQKKARAAILRRTTLRPVNACFGESHHIFRSHTGFPFQITLTKVDLFKNCNARIILTIYESNEEPVTYALNMHSAATHTTPENTIIAAVNTNFLTTLRLFRKAFHEKTLIEWDDRFDAFRKGSSHLERIQQMDFKSRPYIYHIPAYGSTDEIEAGPSTIAKGDVAYTPRKVDKSTGPSDGDHVGLGTNTAGNDNASISASDDTVMAMDDDGTSSSVDDITEAPSEPRPRFDLGSNMLGDRNQSKVSEQNHEAVNVIQLD